MQPGASPVLHFSDTMRAMFRMCWLGLAAALVVACSGNGAKIIDAGVDDARPIDAEVVEDDAAVDAAIDAPIGHPGTGTVTGAVKASSPSYTLFGTLRSGDGTSSSPQYQRRGGITGATQP